MPPGSLPRARWLLWAPLCSLGAEPEPRKPLRVSCLQVQRATGIANSRNVLATATDPNGVQLGVSQHTRGQINFLTKETGPGCPGPCPAPLQAPSLPSAAQAMDRSDRTFIPSGEEGG